MLLNVAVVLEEDESRMMPLLVLPGVFIVADGVNIPNSVLSL